MTSLYHQSKDVGKITSNKYFASASVSTFHSSTNRSPSSSTPHHSFNRLSQSVDHDDPLTTIEGSSNVSDITHSQKFTDATTPAAAATTATTTGGTTHIPTTMASTKVPTQAILCVIGGFIIHLCLGVLYTWSVITAPVTSYLRQYEPAISYNDTILIYSISLFIQAGSMVLGGLLSDSSVLGVKKCCLVGSFFLTLSMLLVGLGACCCSNSSSSSSSGSSSSSSSSHSDSFFDNGLTKMILFYSFPFGLGIGLSYTPPIAASVRWLPQWKGLLTGIIMCGLGIGAMLFGFLCTAVVNPSHENVQSHGPDEGYFPSDSMVVKRVPRMFQTVTVCFLILLPLGCALVNEPPVNHITDNSGTSPTEREGRTSQQERRYEMVAIDNPMLPRDIEKTNDEIQIAGEQEEAEIEISFGNNQDNSDRDRDSELEIRSMGESRHAFLIHDDDETEEDDTVHTSQRHQSKANSSAASFVIGQDKTMKEIACNSFAWHVILCFFCTTGGGMYLLGSFKTLAQQQIHNEAFLATIGSLSTLANSSGRILWGIISDSSIGTINTLLYAILGFVVVLFTFPSAVSIGNEVGFACWSLMIFFFEASNFAIYFPIVVMLFGTKHAASNYGFIVTCYSSFFMLLSYIIAKGEFELRGVCYIIGSITFCGFISLLVLKWRISRHIQSR